MNENEKAILNGAVGAIIKGRRGTVGITRQQLADAAGVNVETLKNIENAKYKIAVGDVIAIAAALAIEPADLVNDAVKEYRRRLAAAEAVSAGESTNVVRLHPRQMSVEQLEQEPSAAHPRDPESDQPEQ